MKARYFLFVSFLIVSFHCFAQSQDDSMRIVRDSLRLKGLLITAKRLNYDFTSLDSVAMDTLPHNFQIYNPAFHSHALNIFTGNIGGPLLSSLFIDREPQTQFVFSQPIAYNFHQQKDILYCTARSPYTLLTYYSSGTKEQSLNIFHTQNINKYFNVGFLGDLRYSEGEYDNQRIKSNSFTLYSAYRRNRYSLLINASLSHYTAQENGGVDSVDSYRKSKYETNVAVSLADASSKVRYRSFFAQQRYYLTGSYKSDIGAYVNTKWNEALSIIHQTSVSQTSRGYYDLFSSKSSNKFYPNNFIDTLKSQDSASYSEMNNKLMLALNANDWLHIPAELRVGVMNKFEVVRFNIISDSTKLNDNAYTYVEPVRNGYISNYFVANLSDRFSKTMRWGLSAEYCFAGDLQNNMKLSGDFEKTVWKDYTLSVNGSLSSEKPGYFMENYSSNHFAWKNNFTHNQKITSIKAKIDLRRIKFSIEGRMDNYINYVYFGLHATPKVATSPFSIYALSVSKQFDLGILHSEFKGTFQFSEMDPAISLPAFSGFNSTYIQFIYFKVLVTQLGWDVYYNTSYCASAYMPATGIFYEQHSKELIGNYPYGDVFANFKLKRARFFIKYERVNSLISASFAPSRGLLIPHYPYNPGSLKIGISWTFYD